MRAPRLRPAVAASAAAAALAATLTGCTGAGNDPAPTGVKGQLTVLTLGPVDTWDPQRLSTPEDIAFAGRTFLRTLTTFPAGGDAAAQREVVGDLATDAGTADASPKSSRERR